MRGVFDAGRVRRGSAQRGGRDVDQKRLRWCTERAPLDGQLQLTIACGSGDVEALKLLLADAGVEDVNRTDSVRAGGRRGLSGERTARAGNGLRCRVA